MLYSIILFEIIHICHIMDNFHIIVNIVLSILSVLFLRGSSLFLTLHDVLAFSCPVTGRVILGKHTQSHPRPQAHARAALTVALGQAVDLRRNSDAEAQNKDIQKCNFHYKIFTGAFLPKNMATAMNARKAYYKKQYILHLQKQIILKLS